MSYCIKPGCQNPQNPEKVDFCLSCGCKLLLRERYRPIQSLSKGGFSRTFLAVDEDIPSKPICVIKQFYFLHEDDRCLNKAVELFHQEAVHLDDLGKHPQIPNLFAHFEQEQQLYLVQELIEGLTLEEELRQGVFEEFQIWELLEDLLQVFQFIHACKTIHRDIKPENIIRRDRDRKLVLIDFGIAKLLTDSAMQRTGTVLGSQYYIPPEQEKGKAIPASDLYSLGVTCIRLLTGMPLSEMYDIEQQQWLWRAHLPPGTKVSDRLAQILDKLLQGAIGKRYKSAAEVLQAIDSTITEITNDTELLPPLYQSQTPELKVSHPDPVMDDFINLHRLLQAQKWKEADRETWQVMCQALGKPIGTHLQISDLDKVPCECLQIIDHLWVKHSQGRFGFSVQTQIYESVRNDYVSFCKRVNWPSYSSNNYYQGLKFSLVAQPGHLPSRIWVGGENWWRHAGIMATKLANCGSDTQIEISKKAINSQLS